MMHSLAALPDWAFAAIVVGGVLLFALVCLASTIRLFLLAVVSGVRVSFMHVIGMQLRKVPVRQVVMCLVRLNKAEIPVAAEQMENHFLAGGDIESVTNTLIAAKGANRRLAWSEAAQADYERVRESVPDAPSQPDEPPPPPAPPPPPRHPDQVFLDALSGMQGVAHTALISKGPGKVKIAGKLLTAVAPNNPEIQPGRPIRVTGVHPTGVLLVEPS